MTTFSEIPTRSWFQAGTGTYQKLPNLNGSNAYKLYHGYAHFNPSARVRPIATPRMGRVKLQQGFPVGTLYSDGRFEFGGRSS